MIRTKNYLVFLAVPIYKDEETDKWTFQRPEFGLEIFKGKPCTTRWLFDWILDIGYLSIWRKAIDLKKFPTPDCTCSHGRGYQEQWMHTAGCPMSEDVYDYETRTQHLRREGQ